MSAWERSVNNTIQLNGGEQGEHPQFDRQDWRYEAYNGDTQLGYWEWVQHRIEATEDSDE